MEQSHISRRARRAAASHKSNRRAHVRQLAKAARSTVFAPLLRDLAPLRLFVPVDEFLQLARCEFLQREGGR
jgi:hypothetical protein